MIAQTWALVFIFSAYAPVSPVIIPDIKSELACQRILEELTTANLARHGKCVQVK